MKFNAVVGLAAALSLAPTSVAWNLPDFFGSWNPSTSSSLPSDAESTGTPSSGGPSFPEPTDSFGYGGPFGPPHHHPSGAHPSGATPSGPIPSGGPQPSGFGGSGFGGIEGGPAPSGPPKPSDGFPNVPTGVPSGFPPSGGPSLLSSSSVSTPSPTPSTGLANGEEGSIQQFRRLHARQIRPFEV